MKRYLWTLMTIHVAAAALSQSDVSTAGWKTQPATIDGRLTEWNQPLRFYDADTKLFFDIANDGSNIYLCFESKDEATQSKLMRAGMKVTLSTKGKTRHDVSVLYPIPGKSAAVNSIEASNKNDDSSFQKTESAPYDKSSFRIRYLEAHPVMELVGFATANGEVPLQNSSGVIAAMAWDTASNLGYEIQIPQKEFFGSDFLLGSPSHNDITLAVEINALPRSASGRDDRMGHPHGGMHGNGGDGMRRGQFNGGGYNAGNEGAPRQWSDDDKVSMNTKSSFKQKFVLSKE